MNNNEEILRIEAKEQVRVFALVVVFLFALGGVWEFKNSQMPLDDLLVVVRGEMENDKVLNNDDVVAIKNEVKKENEEVVIAEKNDNKIEKVEEVSHTDVKVEKESQSEMMDNKIESGVISGEESLKLIDDYWNYFKDINAKVESVELNNRLDKIEAREIVVEKISENPFKEGVIEIYDANKGVVDVEKVNEEKESVKKESTEKEVKEESFLKDEKKVEVIENKEEIVKDVEVVDENGAIDMMKNIINGNKE